MAIGVAVSFFFFKIFTPYYSSIMIGRANVLGNNYVIDHVNNLGKVTDTLALARILNIPDSSAKHIVSIGGYYGIDTDLDGIANYIDFKNAYTYNSGDSVKKKILDVFYIQVQVTNESVFNSVNQGIITSITTNPHFVKQNDVRLQQIQGRIQEINVQLQLLDSLQKFDYFNEEKANLKTSGQLVVWNEKDRQLYHNNILSLYNDKQNLEQQLFIYDDPITVIQDFSTLSVVENPLSLYLKVWVPISLLIGLCFVVIRHYWRRIWNLIIEKHA
jgi:hypothetical protein